ncbi:MAG TPA: response regulator transcription factor [Geobacterales bacterium]|nr:response regulator transcription factor [Geobacterales bacterium]
MPDPIYIAVVDDESEVRHVLRQGLEAEGFAVVEASDKASCLLSLEIYPIKLITLDLKLDHQDGLGLAREIRASRNVPIIMITGCDTPLDRVAGLELGADDYITKPFHIKEVVIRVRRVLATYGVLDPAPPMVSNPSCYAFDSFLFEARKQELRFASGPLIELTETEVRLLELFLTYPGRVLSRDEISQMLRGHEWSPLDRIIDGHVSRLRRKIDSPGKEETSLIKSVRGVGYVFAAEVRHV